MQDAVDHYDLRRIKVEFFLNCCEMPFSFLSAISPPRAGYPFFSSQGAVGSTDIVVPDPVDLTPANMPEIMSKVSPSPG